MTTSNDDEFRPKLGKPKSAGKGQPRLISQLLAKGVNVRGVNRAQRCALGGAQSHRVPSRGGGDEARHPHAGPSLPAGDGEGSDRQPKARRPSLDRHAPALHRARRGDGGRVAGSRLWRRTRCGRYPGVRIALPG